MPCGSAVAAHQDVQAGWDRLGQSVHISRAVAVDAASVENGCSEPHCHHPPRDLPDLQQQRMVRPLAREPPEHELQRRRPTPRRQEAGEPMGLHALQ